MANVLFTNVRILEGGGAAAFAGEVLVQGNRIARIARGSRALPVAGSITVDQTVLNFKGKRRESLLGTPATGPIILLP